jgi:hypothetical protein
VAVGRWTVQSFACTTTASAVFRGRAVTADIAYVSEAGREPGISKVNQQAAICRTNSLGLPHSACVGVLDGHGPQGHLVSHSLAQRTSLQSFSHVTLLCLTPVVWRRRSQVTGFVRDKLPEAVRTSGGAGSPGQRLGAALTAMHTQLVSSTVDCEYSGCTVRRAVLAPARTWPYGIGVTDCVCRTDPSRWPWCCSCPGSCTARGWATCTCCWGASMRTAHCTLSRSHTTGIVSTCAFPLCKP